VNNISVTVRKQLSTVIIKLRSPVSVDSKKLCRRHRRLYRWQLAKHSQNTEVQHLLPQTEGTVRDLSHKKCAKTHARQSAGTGERRDSCGWPPKNLNAEVWRDSSVHTAARRARAKPCRDEFKLASGRRCFQCAITSHIMQAVQHNINAINHAELCCICIDLRTIEPYSQASCHLIRL